MKLTAFEHAVRSAARSLSHNSEVLCIIKNQRLGEKGFGFDIIDVGSHKFCLSGEDRIRLQTLLHVDEGPHPVGGDSDSDLDSDSEEEGDDEAFESRAEQLAAENSDVDLDDDIGPELFENLDGVEQVKNSALGKPWGIQTDEEDEVESMLVDDIDESCDSYAYGSPPTSSEEPRWYASLNPDRSPSPEYTRPCRDYPPEEVITTPTLSRLCLRYNTRYNLVLCDLCESAVPISYLYRHVTRQCNTVSEPKSGNPKDGVYRTGIPHGFKVTSRRQLVEEITTELNLCGICSEIRDVSPGPDGYSLWHKSAVPFDGQEGPIRGLKVFETGVICLACDEPRAAFLSNVSFDQHRSLRHKGDKTVEKYYVGPVQTMTRITGLLRYFPVPRSAPDAELDERCTDDDDDVANLLRLHKASMLRPEPSTPQTVLDRRSIPPFFLTAGVHDFLARFDRKLILYGLGLPLKSVRESTPGFCRLHRILSESYYSDCDIVEKLHPSVQHALLDDLPDGKVEQRVYQPPPLRHSKGLYALAEMKFIWSNLLCFRLSRDPRTTGQSPILHDAAQSIALSNLDVLLCANVFDEPATVKALRSVLRCLYFPEDVTLTAVDVFRSPLMAYLAMQCINKNGYVTVWMIPPLLSKLQSCIRLRAGRHFHDSFQALLASRNRQNWNTKQNAVEHWFETTVMPFCERHLRGFNLSPFANLRHWMRTLSKITRNIRRPYLIQWSGDTLRIQGNECTKNSFAKFLHDELASAEKLLQDEVLFGIELESLGISCHFHNGMDSWDESTLHYGPFAPNPDDSDSPTLDNPDSDKFFRALVEIDALGIRRTKTGLVWNQKKSMRWLGVIHLVWTKTYGLIHTTAGLPGRGSEESLWQLINSLLSRRHVFVRNGTIALIGNFHKGAFATGIYKYILRLLPYRVARLVFILIRVVRPIEVSPILLYVVAGQKKKQHSNDILSLYSTNIFVSWGKAWTSFDLSSVLKFWFKEGLGFSGMGLRMHRHFATALQRRYLKHAMRKDPGLQEIADMQAGRTVRVSETTYGLVKGESSMPYSRLEQFEYVSMGWHAMLGFQTYCAAASDLDSEMDA